MAKYKIAIAGCGGMAHAWADYALKREDSEIVALIDIRIEEHDLSARA